MLNEWEEERRIREEGRGRVGWTLRRGRQRGNLGMKMMEKRELERGEVAKRAEGDRPRVIGLDEKQMHCMGKES